MSASSTLAALVAIASWLAASRASAAEFVHLQLEAPAGCPSEAAIASAVERLVAHTPSEPLPVAARIAGQGTSWQLSVSIAEGSRVVRGDSCSAVSQALVVIVALALDPQANVAALGHADWLEAQADAKAAGAEDAAPEQPKNELQAAPIVPVAPPNKEQPHAPAPTTPLAPREREQARVGAPLLGVSLLALGEVGALPSASAGGALALRAFSGNWGAELFGAWLAPEFARVQGTSLRKGGVVGWWGGALEACRRQGRYFAGCLGAEAGQLTGEGRGIEARTGHALWLAGALTALGRWPLGGGFSAEGRLSLAVPLLRPVFSVEPYGEVHRPDPVSGRILLGIGWR